MHLWASPKPHALGFQLHICAEPLCRFLDTASPLLRAPFLSPGVSTFTEKRILPQTESTKTVHTDSNNKNLQRNKRLGGRDLIYSVWEIKNTVRKMGVNNNALLTESWQPFSSDTPSCSTWQMSTLDCFQGGRKTDNYNSCTQTRIQENLGKSLLKNILTYQYYKLLSLIKPKNRILFCKLAHHCAKGCIFFF